MCWEVVEYLHYPDLGIKFRSLPHIYGQWSKILPRPNQAGNLFILYFGSG